MKRKIETRFIIIEKNKRTLLLWNSFLIYTVMEWTQFHIDFSVVAAPSDHFCSFFFFFRIELICALPTIFILRLRMMIDSVTISFDMHYYY